MLERQWLAIGLTAGKQQQLQAGAIDVGDPAQVYVRRMLVQSGKKFCLALARRPDGQLPVQLKHWTKCHVRLFHHFICPDADDSADAASLTWCGTET